MLLVYILIVLRCPIYVGAHVHVDTLDRLLNAEVFCMLYILWVNSTSGETLRKHRRTLNACNTSRIGVEMGWLSSGLAWESWFTFHWWRSLSFRAIEPISLITLLHLCNTLCCLNSDNRWLCVTANALLLAPMEVILPTFGKNTLIGTTLVASVVLGACMRNRLVVYRIRGTLLGDGVLHVNLLLLHRELNLLSERLWWHSPSIGCAGALKARCSKRLTLHKRHALFGVCSRIWLFA